MAARADITLTDAAGTPVNRVYSIAGNIKDTILKWVDRVQTSVVLGQGVLSLFQRPADKAIPATKVSWKIELPILAQASGGTSSGYVAEPKLSHTLIGTIEFVLPAKSVLQERKDLLAQMRDLIDEAVVTNQVHDYNLIF
jgi:hypothetical protein